MPTSQPDARIRAACREEVSVRSAGCQVGYRAAMALVYLFPPEPTRYGLDMSTQPRDVHSVPRCLLE
jgi:hypothetical protein